MLTPITFNHEFTPALNGISFSQWRLKGIHSIQDLFIERIFVTFDQLREKYKIANVDFF